MEVDDKKFDAYVHKPLELGKAIAEVELRVEKAEITIYTGMRELEDCMRTLKDLRTALANLRSEGDNCIINKEVNYGSRGRYRMG